MNDIERAIDDERNTAAARKFADAHKFGEQSSVAEAVEAVFREWGSQYMRGTIVSRDTEVYNFIQTALADMKTRLISRIEKDASR